MYILFSNIYYFRMTELATNADHNSSSKSVTEKKMHKRARRRKMKRELKSELEDSSVSAPSKTYLHKSGEKKEILKSKDNKILNGSESVLEVSLDRGITNAVNECLNKANNVSDNLEKSRDGKRKRPRKLRGGILSSENKFLPNGKEMISNISPSPNAECPTASLSAEGLALLVDLQFKSNMQKKDVKPRTGKISISELMGNNRNQCATRGSQLNSIGNTILQRLGGNTIDPEAIMDGAIRQMPQVWGFPSPTRHSEKAPISTAFHPDLLKTTMKTYTSALQCSSERSGFGVTSQQCPIRSVCRSPYGRRSALSPDLLLPWINFSPMFPIDNHGGFCSAFGYPRGAGSSTTQRGTTQNRTILGVSTGMSRRSGGNFRSQQALTSPRNGNSPASTYSTQQQFNVVSNQKIRKPFFMPYMSMEAVNRGLATGDLIKGCLRVNQRNYEESYVDNPEGDEQLDLLILGVHDRNRALHGDVVVVRIKERIHWVVRENLYQAWRAGHLNVSREDNGQPLTIPPVPPPKRSDTIEITIGGLSELKIKKTDLEKIIPTVEGHKYDRDAVILIGAQIEVARRDYLASGDANLNSYCQPSSDVQSMIQMLSIDRLPEDLSAIRGISPPKKSTGQQKRLLNPTGKRIAYRLLSDMPDEDWGVPDICLQKTAEVVLIAEAKNCRAAMGQLKMMTDGNRNWALFSPTDSRMPRMMIPADQLPMGFFDRPQDFAKFIFVARMVEWQATAQFARGKLERTLGMAGDIEAETEGLLFANNVDTREFSHAALSCLPISESKQWTIDEKEFKYRRDLRGEVIFTIDPVTARDLDDALSIKSCSDVDGKGTPGWEVGVHIADVAHFVYENTELDTWAASRATSVYLVHKVIPMLPRILCEELCSLNPGVERLTFSVIWKMDDEGNIFDEWFGRTIIKSRVKLSYEHAQDFIENSDKDFNESELPPLFDNVTIQDIKGKVLQLHSIAMKLCAARTSNGALRLDQPKLKFSLDDETKLPNGVAVFEHKESNKLVEEFMLLANMAVARKIESDYPRLALLRRHPPPKQKVLREMLELCEKIGFPLDAASSGRLSKALSKFQGDNQMMGAVKQVLSMMMMKPMQLALYFCAGSMKSRSEYHHYALNVPFYTHFTSPIRRYPDIMVHRLLAAALGYCPPPDKTVHEIEILAQHCNDKKIAAKAVSEASDDTFFGLFVKECGPVEIRGVVVNVLDSSFDVLVLKFGILKRVYVNRLDMARDPIFYEGPPAHLTLFWNPPPTTIGRNNAAIEQNIQMCTVVDVVLSALPEPTKYQAVIKMRSDKDTHTLLELIQNDIKLD